jgi:hypothetical protein
MRHGILALLAFSLGCGDDVSIQADADIGLPEFTIENMDDSGVLHRLTIRCVSLLSETPLTFVTDGPHQHSLQLDVAQMHSILVGDRVEVLFTDGHEHSFAIQKPDEACIGLAPGS